MRIGIFGQGRLAAAVRDAAGSRVAWLAGRDDDPASPVDVAIDCSVAGAVAAHIDWSLANATDLVIAATGWRLDGLAESVSRRIGVVVAPNGSLTVAVMRRLARLLGAYGRLHYRGEAGGYLLDHHHAAKADAPSGTALSLAAAWQEGAGSELGLSVSSLRAGHAAGTHVLGLDAPGEQIELIHRARSRAPFAHGLLHAAEWISGRQGLFTMDDVAAATLGPIFGDN